MLSLTCPISAETRDARVVRTVAALVAILSVAALAIGAPFSAWIMSALAIDFSVRAFGTPRFSALAWIGRFVVAALALEPKLVDAAPKRFAAGIGVLFASASSLLAVLGADLAAGSLIAVLSICATLEAVLGYCVGCRVYALLPREVRRLLTRSA